MLRSCSEPGGRVLEGVPAARPPTRPGRGIPLQAGLPPPSPATPPGSRSGVVSSGRGHPVVLGPEGEAPGGAESTFSRSQLASQIRSTLLIFLSPQL